MSYCDRIVNRNAWKRSTVKRYGDFRPQRGRPRVRGKRGSGRVRRHFARLERKSFESFVAKLPVEQRESARALRATRRTQGKGG